MDKTAQRDGLLAGLTFVTGCVDAISYLGLGQVFTANMTGNTVLLGFAIAQTKTSNAERSVVALAGFALGVAAATRLMGRHVEHTLWPAQVTHALAVELLLLICFAAAWQVIGPAPAAGPLDALIALSAIAMGIQSGAARRLSVLGVSTTYVTGTITTLMTDIAGFAGSPTELKRLGVVVLALFTGAVVGGLTIIHWPQAASVLPAAFMAVVLVLARHGFRQS